MTEINREPYDYGEEVYDLLCLMQKRYLEVSCLEPCAPETRVKQVCRMPICDPDAPFLVRMFVIAGFDQAGRIVCCVVDQAAAQEMEKTMRALAGAVGRCVE